MDFSIQQAGTVTHIPKAVPCLNIGRKTDAIIFNRNPEAFPKVIHLNVDIARFGMPQNISHRVIDDRIYVSRAYSREYFFVSGFHIN